MISHSRRGGCVGFGPGWWRRRGRRRSGSRRPRRPASSGRAASARRVAGSRSASARTDSGLRSGRATVRGRPVVPLRCGHREARLRPVDARLARARRPRTRARAARSRLRKPAVVAVGASRPGSAPPAAPSRPPARRDRRQAAASSGSRPHPGSSPSAAARRSSHHSSGRYSRQPSGSVPRSPTACTLTVIWQLPILPSVPEYWRFTPGECLPSLTIPVSSTTQATTPISRRHPLRAGPHQQLRLPGRVGQKLLHRLVPGRRLLEPKQRRLQALAATLLDQPAHIQKRVLPLPPQRQPPRHLLDETRPAGRAPPPPAPRSQAQPPSAPPSNDDR